MKVLMKRSSKMQKGKRLCEQVKEMFLSTIDGTTSRDIYVQPNGVNGEDLVFSEELTAIAPFKIECKNQEKWSLKSYWEQAKSNAQEGDIPLVIMSKNHMKIPIVAMDLKQFLELIKVNYKNS